MMTNKNKIRNRQENIGHTYLGLGLFQTEGKDKADENKSEDKWELNKQMREEKRQKCGES